MQAAIDRVDFLAGLPLERYLDETVQEHESEITDLNRKQLDKGLDSEGNSLGEYKHFDYKGRWEPVDLKQTGAFRSSFDAQPFGKGFEITASDPKTGELMDKYGDAILGIADENKAVLGEILAYGLSEKIDKAL